MQTIVETIVIAPPYVCLTLAFGLIYGMLGVMDLTIPTRFAAAGYAGWAVTRWLSWYPVQDPLVLIAALIACGSVSALCWILISPLRRGSTLAVLIGSLGLSQALQASFQFLFGAMPKVYSTYPVESGIKILGTTATLLQLIAIGFAAAATISIGLVVRYTSFGHRLMAVAQNGEIAGAALGISVSRVEWTALAVASAILAPSAVIFTSSHGVSPTTGQEIGLLAFVATIIAGRGQLAVATVVMLVILTIRTAALSWPLIQLITVAILISAAFVSWRRWHAGNHPNLSWAFIAVGVASVLVFLSASNIIPARLNPTVPSGLQDAVVYAFVLIVLLVNPNGVLSTQRARVA